MINGRSTSEPGIRRPIRHRKGLRSRSRPSFGERSAHEPHGHIIPFLSEPSGRHSAPHTGCDSGGRNTDPPPGGIARIRHGGSDRSGSPTGCHVPQCFIPRPFTRSVRPVSSHLADLYALAHAPPATVRKSDATYGRINDVSLKRNVSLGRLSMQSAVGHRIILHSDRIISISYTIYFTTHPAVSRHRTDAMSHRCILRFILYICISVPTGTYCLRFFLIVGFDDTEKPSQFPTVLFRPGIFLMRTHRIRRSRSPSLRREQRPN